MKRHPSRQRAVGAVAGTAFLFVILAACGSSSSSSPNPSGGSNDPDNPYPDTTREYLAGPLSQPNMKVPSYSIGEHQTYVLPATPATTQWGVFDNSVPPALRINSGDTVAIETLTAGGGQVVPGITVEQIEKINTDVPGRGPHTVTGPIYVDDAQPGDVVKIHINKIKMRDYATNNSSSTGGLFPEIFEPKVDSYYLDTEKMQMKFEPNIVVPLAPFPGILAVGRPDAASADDIGCVDNSCDTVPPGDFGGNLDLREMTVGTDTYLPVLVPGALIWSGDSHAAQGNGEIDLDALETAFPELNVTIELIKNQPQVTWPIIESPTSWVTLGYNVDINVALDNLKAETVRFIMDKRKISSDAATKAMNKTWNCPISEVVDKVMGTYCIIPKNANAPAAPDLPKKDTVQFWVRTAKNTDLMAAMKVAALASVDQMSAELGITRDRAYRLATFVQDCRIGRYVSGEKEVACMVPKSIMVKPEN